MIATGSFAALLSAWGVTIAVFQGGDGSPARDFKSQADALVDAARLEGSIAGIVPRRFSWGGVFVDAARLEAAGLTKHWEVALPLLPGEFVEKAFLVDEALYVGTTEGTLFSVKADAGLIRWGVRITEPGYTIFRPSHIQMPDGAGPALVTATNGVWVLDRFSGELFRRVALDFPPGGTAVGRGRTIFLGGVDAHFYSLGLPEATQVDALLRWRVKVSGPVTAAPVLWGGTDLVFASQGGMVYSCRAGDKALNWYFRTGGPVLGDPLVNESGVYVASADRSIYKLHRDRGTLQWRHRLPRALSEGPIVIAHTVYQFCTDLGIVAIDAATGAERWHAEEAIALAAHTKERDILFTDDGRLRMVEPQTGKFVAEIDVNPAIIAVTNSMDDAVYLLSLRGDIACARAEPVPYLRLQQIRAAEAQLNTPPAPLGRDHRPEALIRPKPSDDDPLRSYRDVTPPR